MIGRRALLKAAAGIGLMPAPMIGSGFASALQGGAAANLVSPVAELDCHVSECDAIRHSLWRLFDEYGDCHQAALPDRLPSHIATKRSWSQAFKGHEAMREYREFRELQRRVQRDEKFARRLAEAIGLNLEDS